MVLKHTNFPSLTKILARFFRTITFMMEETMPTSPSCLYTRTAETKTKRGTSAFPDKSKSHGGTIMSVMQKLMCTVSEMMSWEQSHLLKTPRTDPLYCQKNSVFLRWLFIACFFVHGRCTWNNPFSAIWPTFKGKWIKQATLRNF